MEEPSPQEVTRWLRLVARRLTALTDPVQRYISFAREVDALGPSDAARALQEIIFGGFRRRARASKILAESALLALAERRWDDDHREATKEAALEGEWRLAALMLAEVDGYPELAETEDAILPVPDYTGERPLTLGERRSLARSPERRLLALAMRDPHPMVIEKLLDNPRVTQYDMLVVASGRPASAEVLIRVALHTRWRTDPRVALALFNNPYLSPEAGLTLVHWIKLADMRRIARNQRLSPLIREAARELVAGDGRERWT
jgi:hypothetical protein